MIFGCLNITNCHPLDRIYEFTDMQKFDNVSGQKFLIDENKKTFDYIRKTELGKEKKGIYLWH